MTAESEQSSSDPGAYDEATRRQRVTPSRSTEWDDSSVKYKAESQVNSSTEAQQDTFGETPEVLRFRADSLLDEMMLGAVDVSAADVSRTGGVNTTPDAASLVDEHTSVDAHTSRTDYRAYSSGQFSDADGSELSISGAVGHQRSANGNHAGTQAASSVYAADVIAANRAQASWSASSEPSGEQFSQSKKGFSEEELASQPTPEWRVRSGGVTSDGAESTWNEYVTSFRSPSGSDGQIQKWQPDSPADGYDNRVTRSSENQEPTNRFETPPSTEARAEASEPSVSSSDSRAGTGFVSSMAVMSTGPRRSSLLPRMSRFDVDSLNREIADLHEEIRALLPIGHDQAERAQHLLDKAHSIAESDPQRSAEVEYYMQQVRTIVERTRQSRKWSDLYRSRLRIYLLAWALLATMTLVALLISQFQIEAMVASIFGTARDGLFMRNFSGVMGSMMAGALGGSLGAMLNMRRHSRTQYGFFDRKYGLRGLILPIIGAVVGLLIYAVFGIVYLFANINPSLSAVAMALPAILAFIFGFSQESIYGTSG